MKQIKAEDYWEELTSHPEILNTIVRPMPGWGNRKSYCVGLIPWGQEVARTVEKLIGKPVIFMDSQNMFYHLNEIDEHVLFLAHSRCDDLGHDELLLLGEWVYGEGVPRETIFQTPEGNFWKVKGKGSGDASHASAMWFEKITEETVLEKIRQTMDENPFTFKKRTSSQG